MIYSLTGKVSMIDENTIVVDTGAVSFEVICSSYTAFSFSQNQDVQTVLTYLQVREDAMTLYGFKDKREKFLFMQLTQVSGIGPKMAISILSGLPIDEIVKAIANSDVKLLSSIKGLGKKTAERVILELSKQLGGEGGLENLISTDGGTVLVSNSVPKEIEETVDVLVSTGVQKSQAIEMAKKNYETGMTSEQLVLKCFKNLR